MKSSILLATETTNNAFSHFDSSQNVTKLLKHSPVRGLKLIAKMQRHNGIVKPTASPAMKLAVQAADRDHKEVMGRYNNAKQLRALEEAAAA